MDSYDLVYPAALTGKLHGRLEFKKIYAAGTDVRITGIGGKDKIEGSLCIGRSGEQLCAAAKQSPRAILISDSRIDRKLISIMGDKDVILCIGLDSIMGSNGINRSKTIYMTSKLLGYAMKKEMDVAIVTLAKSEEMLCSPIQIIEIAKLLGADEAYARNSIGKVNRMLVE